MSKLLFINACVRWNKSRTKILCDRFLENFTRLNPHVTIETVDLTQVDFPCLDDAVIEKREALIIEENYTDRMFNAAKQFAGADKIVIGAPHWDFSFPAVLKCYIENICVRGITFQYGPEGLMGICKAEKMLYITTAGGKIYGGDLGFVYLKELFTSLFGINAFEYIAAEELDIEGYDVTSIMNKKITEIDKLAQTF